jgi:hypothetical protein
MIRGPESGLWLDALRLAGKLKAKEALPALQEVMSRPPFPAEPSLTFADDFSVLPRVPRGDWLPVSGGREQERNGYPFYFSFSLYEVLLPPPASCSRIPASISARMSNRAVS